MEQRIFIRLVFALAVLWFIVKGLADLVGCGKCVHEPQPVEVVWPVEPRKDSNAVNEPEITRVNRRTYDAKPVKLDLDKIDAKIGLCTGYEWGSGKGLGKKERVIQLNRQGGWDFVSLFYGENGHGLEAFTLVRKGIWRAELSDVAEAITTPWVKSGRKTDVRTLSKGKSFATLLLPRGDIDITITGDVVEGGKKVDLNLALVNNNISTTHLNLEEMLKDAGYKP